MITDKMYLDKGGGICPFCQSDQIEGGSIDIDGDTAAQRVGCLVCDHEWFDLYKLIGFDPIDTGIREWTGTKCSVCKEPQFKTLHGVCCENGHGGAPAMEET